MISCPHCGHPIVERKAGEPRVGMTPTEKKLLDFLVWFSAANGYFPTYEEMAAALGLKSKSGIHGLIASLSDKQYITRLRSRARAIALVPT